MAFFIYFLIVLLDFEIAMLCFVYFFCWFQTEYDCLGDNEATLHKLLLHSLLEANNFFFRNI